MHGRRATRRRSALATWCRASRSTIVLKVTLPDGVEGEEAVLRIRADAEEGALDAPPVEVRWTWASHERNDAQPRDTAVDLQVAGIYAARARRDALELNRQGDYDGARRLLERVAKRIESYAGASLELQGLARSLRAEARQFEREMDAMSMKQVHYSSRAAMRSRTLTGKAQRGRFDAEAFDVELHRGVPVIVCDGVRAAIVTGTPASFGSVPLRMLGQSTTCRRGGCRRDRRVHRPVPGNDDRRGDRRRPPAAVRVPDRPRHEEGGVVPWQPRLRRRVAAHAAAAGCSDRGDPVGARHGIAFLDTGTRLSYLDPAAVTGRPVGREKDFFPIVGEFETDVYEAEIEFAGLRFRGRFGLLPTLLQQSMAALGAQWVIGSELLQQFPVLLDLQHHRIMIVQQQPSFMAIH